MAGSRLINDHSFECLNLVGMTVESFVGYYEGEAENGIDIVILKLKELDLYQRFFLDAAIGFWEEYDLESAISDYKDVKETDLTKKFSLMGTRLSSIICNGSLDEFSSLAFDFGGVRLSYRYLDTKDMDSETVLEKL